MVTEARIGKKKTISVWSIVALVGGAFAIIAFFLQWLSVSDFGGAETFRVTGIDLLLGKLNGTDVTYSFVSKLPLIIALLSVLIIVISLLPTFIRKDFQMSYLLTAVSAITLILCIVFMIVGLRSSLFSDDWKTYAEAASVTYAIGAGAVMATIGSIMATVGGALNIKEYR